MRQATVSFDDGIFEALELQVFQNAGLLDLEILSCDGRSGTVLVHVEDEVDEQQLDVTPTIGWWEKVATDRPEHVYLFEGDGGTTETMAADGEQFARTERIRLTSDGATLTWVGSQEELQTMLSEADALGLDAALEQLGDYRVRASPLESLTSRQREVLQVAFERGYYDVPRRASTAELAAELDLDDSSVSEHLQRAERNLIAAVLHRPG